MIRKASTFIASAPPQLPDSAPAQLLAKRIAALEQTLRDIHYFKQGFGLSVGSSKPGDMKLNSPATAGTGQMNTFHTLFNHFEAADVQADQKAASQVRLDYAAVFDGVMKRLNSPHGATAFMKSVIDLCNGQAPHDGWQAFRSLPYEREVRDRASLILDTIDREPSTIPLVGFYFNIDYPSQGDDTVADVFVSADDTYEPDDDEWRLSLKYTPLKGRAHSTVLASIYRLAYSKGGLGKAADYSLSLAWASYFARACVYRYREVSGTRRVGLGVGFGDGDWMDLGWL
jgi:hypothetical protein